MPNVMIATLAFPTKSTADTITKRELDLTVDGVARTTEVLDPDLPLKEGYRFPKGSHVDWKITDYDDETPPNPGSVSGSFDVKDTVANPPAGTLGVTITGEE